MLLDTTYILDLLHNDAGAIKKAKEIKASGEIVFASTISVFELWQGAADIKDPLKRNRIETLLVSIGLLVLDVESAKEAGTIHNECYRTGRPMDPEDSMIAGIAQHHHQCVLTRNVKHFSRVQGIRVESY